MFPRLWHRLALIGLLALAPPVAADDWPMLGRDASRNAVSPEKNPPQWWVVPGPDVKGSGKNVKWQAALGNRAKGDPVVANGLVWVGTDNGQPRDPKMKDQAPALMCFREKDGAFLYQYVTVIPPKVARFNELRFAGHSSAPLVEKSRLWFTTVVGEVVCLDVGPLELGQGQPREIWKLDMAKTLGVFPSAMPMGYGRTCSVAGFRDFIYVLTGNGVEDDGQQAVPAPNAPSLVCLHKDTGKVIWSDASPGKNIVDGQYASPLVAEINGQAQVIAPMGDGWIRAFDAVSGAALWQFDGSPKEPGKPQERNNWYATPVLYQGRVYIGTGESPASPRNAPPGWLYCLDPSKKGDISSEVEVAPGKLKPNPNTGMIWRFGGLAENKRQQFRGTLASVCIHAGLVIANDSNGYVLCLDAETGRLYWKHDIQATITGAPLIVGDKVFIGSEDGEVFILALQKEKRVLGCIDIGDPTSIGPVFANGVLFVASSQALYAIAGDARKPGTEKGGFWPQWRGPDRTNRAREEGLLKSWPKDGPPLAWKAEGLGTGPMSISVADGRIFALGYKEEHEYLNALDETDGTILWSRQVGPSVKGNTIMQWLSQRSPTVDGERVYAFGVKGDLVCMETATGKELWRKHYVADFAGEAGRWGFCDYPLVDGDRLICTPGGAKAAIVALNKRTGAVIWRCALPEKQRATYGAAVLVDRPSGRISIHQLDTGTVAVATADGKLLWQHKRGASPMGNVHTAIVRDDLVFHSNGWSTGCGLLKLGRPPDEGKVEELYYKKVSLDPWLGSSVLLGDHVHTSCGKCIELATGKVIYDLRLTRTTMTCADGRFYHRSGNNLLLMHEYTPEGYVQKAEFQVPRHTKPTAPAWSFPVIAGGKLYLRDQDVLLCYDLREKKDRPRAPDAIFVPTPQDVVDKMLEIAGVQKTDRVVDLGCGDGRIVVTAAKKYGCRAVGYDLDPRCIQLARDKVRSEKVEGLVTIEQKDVFALDLGQVDVVALYLLPRLNVKLLPQLKKLRPGARIVSHEFPMAGIRPDRVVRYLSREDGVEHTLYLWTVPLKSDTQH